MIVGFAVAVLIAAVARKRAQLSTGGAFAAIALGTLAVSAGVRWGVLLVAYFVTATLLSSWQRTEKSVRTAAIIDKRGARDAWQVIANGGVFVLVAFVGSFVGSDPAWFGLGSDPTAGSDPMVAAALGALAASMADTAATEVGGAIGGEPRSIVSGQKVASGLSGGVTLAGTLAMFGGSAAIGTFAVLLGFGSRAAWAAFAGGVAGSLADSLLGAVLQERRRCAACGSLTERRMHNCRGVAVSTAVVGGVPGLDNDWVNLTSTAVGALVAGVLSRGGI